MTASRRLDDGVLGKDDSFREGMLGVVAQGEVDEGLFFEGVGFGGAGGWAGCGGALYAYQGAGFSRRAGGHAAHQWEDVGECAHVGRLFLDPDNFGGRGVLVEGGLEFGFRPRVELLEEDDADGRGLFFCEAALRSLDAEVVADLAGADEQAAGMDDVVVGEDVLEVRMRRIGAEVRDGRHGIGVAEHGLGGEDDEGLAPLAQGLAAQQVEILRGGGGLRDLDVVLRG